MMVTTTGGSPIKPSEVALLEVDSLTALTEAAPEDWQVLKKATKAEVRALASPLTSRGWLPRHWQGSSTSELGAYSNSMLK